jgi:hypothetical protein
MRSSSITYINYIINTFRINKSLNIHVFSLLVLKILLKTKNNYNSAEFISILVSCMLLLLIISSTLVDSPAETLLPDLNFLQHKTYFIITLSYGSNDRSGSGRKSHVFKTLGNQFGFLFCKILTIIKNNANANINESTVANVSLKVLIFLTF